MRLLCTVTNRFDTLTDTDLELALKLKAAPEHIRNAVRTLLDTD